MILLSLVCGGCESRIISEAFGLVMGPKAVEAAVTQISPVKQDTVLAKYTHFELQFTDNFGGRMPKEFFVKIGPAFDLALADRDIRNRRDGTGRTLLIRGEVWHYEVAEVIDHLFGPVEELATRVTFIDKSTGQVLGVYNCIGRSTHTVNIGLDNKIKGLAKAIATIIADHYPTAK